MKAGTWTMLSGSVVLALVLGATGMANAQYIGYGYGYATYCPPPVYVAPAPVVVAPPPVYVAPPVYCAPVSPVYYAPRTYGGFSFGWSSGCSRTVYHRSSCGPRFGGHVSYYRGCR